MNPIISSHGYSDANIFFLGGFPFGDDLKTNLALSGSTESTLNSFLHEHRLNIKQCYRSLFIKEPLSYSGNNASKLKKALAEIDVGGYENLLFEEINQVNPNIIVPIDDTALSAVYPNIRSNKLPRGRKAWLQCYRGSILRIREEWQSKLNSTIRVIPTYGPRQLYIDASLRSIVSIDFTRIAVNKDKKTPIEDYGLRWVAKTNNELTTFINRSLAENPQWLAFDIETYGGLLTCISFSFNGFEGISVPLCDDKINKYEMALIWRTVGKILDHPIKKVNQNIKYDWTILERHGFYVRNVSGDSMLAGALLYPEFPKGLDFYTSIYTAIPYYKDEGKEFNPKAHTRDRLYLYNAQDSIAAHKVHTQQLEELNESGAADLYHNEVVPLILIYKNIDNTGILVDSLQKEKLLTKYEILYDNNLSTLRTLIGEPSFNPRSNPQCGNLIYNELKFPRRTKTSEDGKQSFKTDKDTLDDLLINHAEDNKLGCSIISRITMCRKLGKVIEYINTPLHPDGRFKGSSNLAGTVSGRSSFSKTIDESWDNSKSKLIRLGRSLQTITKHGFTIDEEIFDDFDSTTIANDLRSMFIPSPGYIFVEGDGNSAEARIVAVLAEDYDWLESFDKKPKIHAKMAALIWGLDVDSITKDSPRVPKIGVAYYDLGKRGQHACNYDMGAFRFSQMTHLPIAESQSILDRINALRPNIKQVYHHEINEAIRKDRVLTTSFGRRRDFFGKLNNEIYKQAYAQIPQSTISDLTKFTMPRISCEMGNVRFLAEMHDGILAEIKKDEKNKYLEVFKKHYERKFNFEKCTLKRSIELSIPCELSVSETNWMELKEIKI